MFTYKDYEKRRDTVIKYLIYSFRVDKYTAEDIFQDGYEDYHKSLDKINNGDFDDSGLSGYIKGIVKYKFLRS